MPGHIFSVRLDDDLAKWVRKKANKNTLPSEVIREAISNAMHTQNNPQNEQDFIPESNKDLKLIRKLLEAIINEKCSNPGKVIDDSVASVYRDIMVKEED